MKMKTAALVAVLILAGGLAACETATPYQPLEKGTSASGGFTDQRLDADHFRVTFQGNDLTSRETVETYLLYRAAELTVAQGFDWFETVDRHTERDRRTYVDPDPFYGPGYPWGFWRPSWRYWGGGFGWRTWGPFWGDPFWADSVQIQTVQKFEASAEIVMGHGPKLATDARAFDARAVMTNLGPKILRPAPPKA
jgi:hypothetical protein